MPWDAQCKALASVGVLWRMSWPPHFAVPGSVEQSPQVNTTAEMTPPNPSCVAGPFLDTEFNIALVFLSQKPVRGHSGRFRADVNDIISCKDPCTAWHEVNNWPRS